jgi:hypothetical protein
VAAISQDPNDPTNTTWPMAPRWRNVFTVSGDRTYALPTPMRVVPRYAVCGAQGTPTACAGYDETSALFSAEELANNDFANPPTGTHVAQRHRNYFAIVYSPDGELEVDRDVLIRDVDADCDVEKPTGGDITGIRVGAADCTALVPNYFNWSTNQAQPIGTPGVEWLVTGADNNATNAINFPSVDGLLVYDDSLFNEAGDATAKRKYLLESAQPFYIQRLTGAVVRGPVGEVPATP